MAEEDETDAAAVAALRCATVFSASNYGGSGRNLGAYLTFSRFGTVAAVAAAPGGRADADASDLPRSEAETSMSVAKGSGVYGGAAAAVNPLGAQPSETDAASARSGTRGQQPLQQPHYSTSQHPLLLLHLSCTLLPFLERHGQFAIHHAPHCTASHVSLAC